MRTQPVGLCRTQSTIRDFNSVASHFTAFRTQNQLIYIHYLASNHRHLTERIWNCGICMK